MMIWFEDDYVETVERAFSENPTADVVVFNLKEKVPTKLITKKQKSDI